MHRHVSFAQYIHSTAPKRQFLKKYFSCILFQKVDHFRGLCQEYLFRCRAKESSDENLYDFPEEGLKRLTEEQVNDFIKKSREDLKIMLNK